MKNKVKIKAEKARAESLSADQRKKIASNAAKKRWDLPQAQYFNKPMIIGEMSFACVVLDDGRRILSTTGIAKSLGSRSGGLRTKLEKLKSEGTAPLPLFIAPDNLKPFIPNDLADGLSRPIKYLKGTQVFEGFNAEHLPAICNVWLDARREGKLLKHQKSRADKAELLIRSLAHVGIIALVDEATGYQDVRGREALQLILDQFLRKEFAAWAKTFPDEFYTEMFRLRNWTWKAMKGRRPQVVGRYTNNIVYERLAPGILSELETKNPKNNLGKRESKHHQWLTTDIGHPALAQHLHAVMSIMRSSYNWKDFIQRLDLAFPKKDGSALQLQLSLKE